MKHTPRKRFGQNFLKDFGVIRCLLDSIPPTHHLVEIGPGLLALTHHLIPKAEVFSAIEIDRDLVENFRKHFPSTQFPSVSVYSADALKFDFASLSPQPFRVVGNLPYNISTPLLIRFFKMIDRIQDLNIMLQKEVVDRLEASPGTKNYGRLSVMAQYFCEVIPVMDIPPEAFYPAPKVDSSFVRLVPKSSRPDLPFEILETVVREAFHCRRKTLANNLKAFASKAELSDWGFNPERRPETLSVEEYIALTQKLIAHSKTPN